MTKIEFSQLTQMTVAYINFLNRIGFLVYKGDDIDELASIKRILNSGRHLTTRTNTALKAALDKLEPREFVMEPKNTGREINKQQMVYRWNLSNGTDLSRLFKRHQPAPNPVRLQRVKGGSIALFSLDEVEVWEEKNRILRFSNLLAQEFIRAPKLRGATA